MIGLGAGGTGVPGGKTLGSTSSRPSGLITTKSYAPIGKLAGKVTPEAVAIKPVLVPSPSSSRGIVVGPTSLTSKPISIGLKFSPLTTTVISTVAPVVCAVSTKVIIGAMGKSLGVGVGVTGVEVLVTVGVGGLKGK